MTGKVTEGVRRSVRVVAAEILRRVEHEGAFVDKLLLACSQRSDLLPAEFPVIQKMVKGVVEHRLTLDDVLRRYLERWESTPDAVRQLLRIALYQLTYLDRVPPHHVVHESVAVVKETPSMSRYAGLVNGVLRSVLRAGEDRHAASASANFPEWLVQRVATQLPATEVESFFDAAQAPPPLTLRANTCRISRAELRERLERSGIETVATQLARDALRVVVLPSTVRLGELPEYREGLFLVQDESSILVAELVDPQPGEGVLDLCAAPGGKSCSLAILSGDQASITAIDIAPRKLKTIREHQERLGLRSISVEEGDGRSWSGAEQFDAVLVDAPCSGLGVLGRKADLRFQRSLEEINGLIQLQGELLDHARTLVRPGGRLIYSTCSIDAGENEGVVRAFCDRHHEVEVLTPPERFSILTTGSFLRTWPHRHGMGGAGAVMLRIHP